MTSFEQKLNAQLAERKNSGLYRQREILTSPQSTDILIRGAEGESKLLSFCSNDYLGLANHPEVIKSFKSALDCFGVGSGASHLITGHNVCHHQLEEELASFTNRSRALVFSSGYMANVGVLTALLNKQNSVFEDRLNHASLLDGGIFSGAKFKRYPHLDATRLQALLTKNKSTGQAMIVSDGIFSMDGDRACLPELLAVAKKNDALLMIDDAHGFGCLGKNGAGIVEYYQEQGEDINQNNVQVLIGTFGKAFGTGGAFVAGSEALIETLIQFCRPYIYTTAMPAAQAEATRCSLKIIQTESWRREKLQSHIKTFRQCCRGLGFTLIDSDSPIQAVILGGVDKTVLASRLLKKSGIAVSAIRPPTVAIGSARLRFTFSAMHTERHIQRLCFAMESIAHLVEVDS